MIETPVTERSGTNGEHGRGGGGPPRFFALFVAPSGTRLAGTCGSGISRAADGQQWSPVVAPLDGADVNAFALAADGALLAAAGTAGVLRSDDDGRTWTTLGQPGGVTFAVHDTGTTLIAGTDRGVVVRSGTGAWFAPEAGPRAAVYRLAALDERRLMAATDGEGVWIGNGDHPAGTRWAPAGLTDRPVFALAALDDGTVVVGTRGGGVQISHDPLSGWHDASDGLPDPVVHVIVVAGDGALLAGTGGGVTRSTDGGRRWHPLGAALAHHRIFSLAPVDAATALAGSYDGVWSVDADGRTHAVDTGLSVGEAYTVASAPGGAALAGVKGGAFSSSDAGGSWTPWSQGLDAGNTYGFCWTASGDVVAGTDDGVRRGTGDGVWRRAGLDGMRVFRVIEPEPGLLLAGTLGHGVQRLEPGGGGPPGWRASNGGLVHRLAFDLLPSPTTGQLFVAAGDVAGGEKTGGVFRSADRGLTWSATDHEPITVYAIVESSGGAIIAGAQRSCILRSFDGGDTWEASRPRGRAESKLYCLVIDHADRLYLGSGAELLRSDDVGESWNVIGAGLDGVTVYAMAVHRSGALLAATTSGIYRSVDRGESFRHSPWPVADRGSR